MKNLLREAINKLMQYYICITFVVHFKMTWSLCSFTETWTASLLPVSAGEWGSEWWVNDVEGEVHTQYTHNQRTENSQTRNRCQQIILGLSGTCWYKFYAFLSHHVLCQGLRSWDKLRKNMFFFLMKKSINFFMCFLSFPVLSDAMRS